MERTDNSMLTNSDSWKEFDFVGAILATMGCNADLRDLTLLATEIREAQRSQSDTFSQTLGVLKSLLMDRHHSSSETIARPCAETESRGSGPSTSGSVANRANANSSNASRNLTCDS